MPVVKGKKSDSQNRGLRSRLASTLLGKNSENNLPGLDNKKTHLRLLEVTTHNDVGKLVHQSKRKTVRSPQGPLVKRTAFSDVTNAIQHLQLPLYSGPIKAEKPEKGKKLASGRTLFKSATKSQPPVIAEDATEEENATLYMSALEDVTPEPPALVTQSQPETQVPVTALTKRSSSEPPAATSSIHKDAISTINEESETSFTELITVPLTEESPSVSFVTALSPTPAWQQSPYAPPLGVKDFDAETAGDANSVAQYAPYIFCYLRSREPYYQVHRDFLAQHDLINHDLRAICVDWMVEVQETLELNHETLYLGVKNLDLFLSNPKANSEKYKTPPLPIRPQRLRLIACASLLLAAQFDERLPPPADDWLHMCDSDYTVTELNSMQQQLFSSLGFDLGAPLSYRFLRRYARACSIDMDLLTLARYILESSLLDSQFSPESDSKMAASALWLAMCMHARPATQEHRFALWNLAFEHYAGYKVSEFYELATRLNKWMQKLPTQQHLRTVYSKYSHRVFRKVALVPTLAEV